MNGSRRLIIVLFACLIGFVVAGLSVLPFGERFDTAALSWWFSLRGKRVPSSEIVVVALDEVSYRDLNVPLSVGPWPRKLHAALLERLANLGAKRVVFDVLFLDPGNDPAGDGQLAAVIAKLPVYLGVESSLQQIAGSSGSFTLEELLEPHEPFAKAAAGLGLVGLPEDGGVVRRFLTERSERTADYPSLAEVGAGLKPGDGRPRPGPRDLINYFGPARTLRTLSYYQVLQTERPIAPELIRDKIVFIGLALRTDTGPAQKDIYDTSYGGLKIFGTEIHATAAANLLSGDWIRRLSSGAEVTGEVLCAVALAAVLMSISPSIGGIVLLVTVVGWLLLSYIGFRCGYFIPGAIVFFAVLPLTYLGTTLYYYFVIRRAANQMKSALELYLSPEMAEQLTRADSGPTLGGAKIWATALFTDIENFTKITEEMPPERVAAMLNAYFTVVREVIFQHGGTLIKFIGDSVFVLWGAPLRIDNHAAMALKAGISLGKEIERFNERGLFPRLRTRIGINTGPMVVGNLGATGRFDYTAIGDSVNLASRVEGLNKSFGTTLLMTEATRKDAGADFVAVRVGLVQVAGKREAVALYTTFEPPPTAQVVAAMEEALESFRKRRWAEARALFQEVNERQPSMQSIGMLYESLIAKYEKDPPTEGWSGALTFAHK